ncbi:M3 family metallopeptidase [bacterium SCSIO 12643]|nr:M3 family metallopeptidase [bacterium SCSIO 12643]
MNKKSKWMLMVIGLLSIVSCQTTNENQSEKKVENKMKKNPILEKWDTPFGTPPFDKIKSTDYLPAFEEAIVLHNEEIAEIIENSEEASFENTIVAFEKSGSDLDKVKNLFYAVEAANTNPILKETANKIAPVLSAHDDDILLNSKLFERVKYVYANEKELTGQNKRLLDETYKSFVRSGAELDPKQKEKLKEINSQLASLSQRFGNNLLDETNAFELYITDSNEIKELPKNLKAIANQEALSRGHENGWVFTLQRPSINPFLQSSTNREYRRQLFDGYALRGDNDNEKDNKAILEEMVTLRLEKANMLGYKTHADFVLSNNMAENPEAVYQFMDKLWPSALEMAKEERALLAASMKKDGVTEIFEGSDWRYYVEKIRAEKYSFNEEETRPYFEFNAVREGAFMLANKLFGLKFKQRDDISTWHPDQQVFEVLENDGTHLGILYMDFFTRDSKRGGAWMNDIRPQSNMGEMVTPIVTNNFNFPPSTPESPSLLSFSEAQTLFHEFGHALHGLFSNVKYASQSGTNVPRDFVEFPSQVMENWMSEPEVLKLYAKHYQTGEVIPDELVERMNQANQFNSGFRTLEYMAAAYLDMAWHNIDQKTDQGAREFEKAEMKRLGMIEEIVPRYRSTYFSHIFSGGYSAGYYAYLWSEVLDADAFQAFKDAGIFDQTTAQKYRVMLSKGGSEPGMDLYVEFRGQKPDIEPLLKKKGFK